MFDNDSAARSLMGLSLVFHICFSMIGIGLPMLLLIAEGIYLKTGNVVYREMAKRWTRVAAVLFAVGAVSGTILSFEFGLLWPTFMRFSGGVIGFPFALEGFAFFTEAIFLGIYAFGWERLSARAHWLCTVPLVVSTAFGALFVISANAWMNQPRGFEMIDGKAVNVAPLRAMLSPALPYQFLHGTLAAYVVTGFAVAGVAAFALLRGDRTERQRRAMALALGMALVATVLQVGAGHLSARFVAHNEPEKFAAMEGQFTTESGAPLRIGGIPDVSAGETRYAIEIPKLGSLFAFEDPDAVVQGLNAFADVPDARAVHYPFQLMVAIGMFLLAVGAWFFVTLWRRGQAGRLLLLAVLAAAPLSFVAMEAGWLVTEFGRQPWVIYQVMRTSEAVTPRDGVVIMLGVFAAVYVALAAGLVLLLGPWRPHLLFGQPRGGSVSRVA